MKIQKGMFRLPQAGKIANNKLKLHLAKFGYAPSPITPVLWLHQTCPFKFSLVVGDFGVKLNPFTSHTKNNLQDLLGLV